MGLMNLHRLILWFRSSRARNMQGEVMMDRSLLEDQDDVINCMTVYDYAMCHPKVMPHVR